VVLAVNKWDAADKEARERIKHDLAWKLGFLGFADTHFISAKSGKGLGELMRSVDGAYAAAMAKLSTPKLTRALMAAVERQSPPRKGMRRPKLRYAHQGGQNPPRVIIHGNSLDEVPDTYRRYLEGYFRNAFDLHGTPLSIEFRTGRNPYKGTGSAAAYARRKAAAR
jgi:GTP-binding protein